MCLCVASRPRDCCLGTVVTGTRHHTQQLQGLVGSELRFSCLHSKYFTYQAIPTAQQNHFQLSLQNWGFER